MRIKYSTKISGEHNSVHNITAHPRSITLKFMRQEQVLALLNKLSKLSLEVHLYPCYLVDWGRKILWVKSLGSAKEEGEMKERKKVFPSFFFFFFWWGGSTGFGLRDSHLLVRCTTTWATPPAQKELSRSNGKTWAFRDSPAPHLGSRTYLLQKNDLSSEPQFLPYKMGWN
jgi:hypothetical protein